MEIGVLIEYLQGLEREYGSDLDVKMVDQS